MILGIAVSPTAKKCLVRNTTLRVRMIFALISEYMADMLTSDKINICKRAEISSNMTEKAASMTDSA
jgi:hypothetical protein